MIKKLASYFNEEKHRVYLITALSLIVLLMMWVFKKDAHTEAKNQEEVEFGAVIPQGYSLLPLEINNSLALSFLVTKYGVIDLFLNNQILARNLKIIKVSHSSEVPSFAALVPDKIAGIAQDFFTKKNLKGALKKHLNAPVEFFIPKRKTSLITTYVTEEGL